jgi:adenine phosphoribosyltransferase
MNLEKYIAEVKDFPIKGIVFKDITPLMNDGQAFKYAVDQISEYARSLGAEIIM